MYIDKFEVLRKFKKKISDHNNRVILLEKNYNDLLKLIELSIVTLNKNGKIIFAGNGGSASQSLHLAAELINKFKLKRNAISSLALTSDTSTITAIANDSDFKYIFSRQIEANSNKNDLLILLSSSNDSKNISEAIKVSKKMGINCCLITSKHSKKKSNANFIIRLPSIDTASYQEIELIFSHFYIEILENLAN